MSMSHLLSPSASSRHSAGSARGAQGLVRTSSLRSQASSTGSEQPHSSTHHSQEIGARRESLDEDAELLNVMTPQTSVKDLRSLL